jgi:hypothetical protein
MNGMARSLVILLLDADGKASLIAGAARRAGHRPVIATGLDTALVVLGSLLPDVVVVRSRSDEEDRIAEARLKAASPDVPIRFVEAPAALPDALDVAPLGLN